MPPPTSSQPVTDDKRDKLEEAMATALLLIYAGHRQRALQQLGVTVETMDVPDAEAQKVLDFARQRSVLIQDGVNSRSSDAQMRASIDEYNRTVLQPYLTSWAQHQGTLAGYQAVTRPDGSTAAQTKEDGSPQLWDWTQNTDFQDDCTEAMGASPTSLDDLTAITGSPPPVHERCQCTLTPQ